MAGLVQKSCLRMYNHYGKMAETPGPLLALQFSINAEGFLMEDETLFSRGHALKHGISMNELWLKKAAAEAVPAAPKKEGHPFITISRQAGAGGHSLAVAILKEIEKKAADPIFQGWQIFDNELCQLVMKDDRLKVPLEFLMTERFRTASEDLWAEIFKIQSPQLAVVRKVFECVRTLAKVGKVILVGRAGSCLTRDLKTGVHIRLVAPLRLRIRRVMELWGVGEGEARKLVEDWDQSRAKLIRAYFSRDIEDPLLFDAVWNTGEVSMETIARCVIEMVCQKAQNSKN